jgi:hypothetical protein
MIQWFPYIEYIKKSLINIHDAPWEHCSLVEDSRQNPAFLIGAPRFLNNGEKYLNYGNSNIILDLGSTSETQSDILRPERHCCISLGEMPHHSRRTSISRRQQEIYARK